jgi:hypothetical protein
MLESSHESERTGLATEGDSSMSDPVTAFHNARPYYDRANVEVIAEHARRENIPFCTECNDWHFASEDHSMPN